MADPDSDGVNSFELLVLERSQLRRSRLSRQPTPTMKPTTKSENRDIGLAIT
jgi:hypothetical protein